MDPSVIIETVKELFSGKNGVQLVFVFGSAVQRRLGPESDIDIAVQFDRKPDPFYINHLKDLIAEKLKREVDLVVLNQASPILRMQVLKNGVLVYFSERMRYDQFFVDTINQYDDLKRVRRPGEESILKGRIYA